MITIETVNKHIQTHKVTYVLALILIVFHSFIEKLISLLFVKTLLGTVNESLSKDFLFIIGGLFLLVVTIMRRKRKYQFSERFLGFCIFIFFTYCYYRFAEETPWLFTPLESVSVVKYLDLLPFYCLLYAWGYFSCKKHCKLHNVGFAYDEPVEEINGDKMQRNIYAKQLADKIKRTNSAKSSFAIGISAEWGSGKTSFLNLLKENLQNDKERVVVDFNPWLNHQSQSIIKDFFKTLSVALKPYSSNLAYDLNRYAQLLVDANNKDLNKFLKPIKNILFPPKSAKEEFDEINELIKKANIQVVIVIDDIDRLQKEEILEVLKLIRNTANFANTIFITAYDHAYILNALKDFNQCNTANYLEKIFQLEIPLPRYENEVITKKLYELIFEKLTLKDQKEFENILNHQIDINTPFYFTYLTSIRDITRFVNSFLTSYEALKGEVCLFDLFCLEILKTKYFGVYQILFSRQQQLLELVEGNVQQQDQNRYVLAKPVDNKDWVFAQPINSYKKNGEESILKVVLSDTPDAYGISENEINSVISLLETLFYVEGDIFDYESLQGEKLSNSLSIINPISFHRYSYLRLADGELGYNDFANVRVCSQEDISSKFIEWGNMGFGTEITRFLDSSGFSSLEDFVKVMNAVFIWGRSEIEKGLNHNKLWYIYNYLKERISLWIEERGDYRDVFVEIVKNAPLPYSFELYLLEEFKTYHVPYFMGKEDSLFLHFFNTEINENKLISKRTISLYLRTIWSTPPSFHEEISSTFLNHIQQDIDGFLIGIIESVLEKYLLHDDVRILDNIFGGISGFEQYIENIDDQKSEYLDKFKEFYYELKDFSKSYSKNDSSFKDKKNDFFKSFHFLPIPFREFQALPTFSTKCLKPTKSKPE